MRIQANKKILEHLGKFNVEKRQSLLQSLGVPSEREVTLMALHKLLLLKNISPRVKEIACSIIMANGSKKSIAVLLKAFGDKDGGLSNMAMLALSVIRSDRALDFMIETLKSSPNERKRRDAAYVLQGYFDNERAVDALIDALSDKSQSSETRAQAAEGLGTLSATRATEILVANLRDPSFEVRAECVWALGQVGMDAAIIPKLEKFLKDKSKAGIRTMEEEASEAIKFIKARVIALENYTGDKSKVDIWTIHAETLELVEEMEKIETTSTLT